MAVDKWPHRKPQNPPKKSQIGENSPENTSMTIQNPPHPKTFIVTSRNIKDIPVADILTDAKAALRDQIQKFKLSAVTEKWTAQECAAFKSLVSSALSLEGYEKEAIDEVEIEKLSDEDVLRLAGKT